MLYQGAFTIYVYNARWVCGQKSGKFDNIYGMKIVNEGRWMVKNVRKIVNVNCECPLSTIIKMCISFMRKKYSLKKCYAIISPLTAIA